MGLCCKRTLITHWTGHAAECVRLHMVWVDVWVGGQHWSNGGLVGRSDGERRPSPRCLAPEIVIKWMSYWWPRCVRLWTGPLLLPHGVMIYGRYYGVPVAMADVCDPGQQRKPPGWLNRSGAALSLSKASSNWWISLFWSIGRWLGLRLLFLRLGWLRHWTVTLRQVTLRQVPFPDSETRTLSGWPTLVWWDSLRILIYGGNVPRKLSRVLVQKGFSKTRTSDCIDWRICVSDDVCLPAPVVIFLFDHIKPRLPCAGQLLTNDRWLFQDVLLVLLWTGLPTLKNPNLTKLQLITIIM